MSISDKLFYKAVAASRAAKNGRDGAYGIIATTPQLARIKRDWSRIAGEPIAVEQQRGVFIGSGSELGVMRLLHKYLSTGGVWGGTEVGSVRVDKSPMRGWYFSLRT